MEKKCETLSAEEAKNLREILRMELALAESALEIATLTAAELNDEKTECEALAAKVTLRRELAEETGV